MLIIKYKLRVLLNLMIHLILMSFKLTIKNITQKRERIDTKLERIVAVNNNHLLNNKLLLMII
jgi:hypothetical protein